jgi:hypothetical protein
MTGKVGGDTFVFETPFSALDVVDFDAAIDRLDVSAFDTEFQSLTLLSDDSSLIIDTGHGLIRLFGVTELQAEHFLF